MRLMKLFIIALAVITLAACGDARPALTGTAAPQPAPQVEETAPQPAPLAGDAVLQPAPLAGDAVPQPAGGQTGGLTGVAQPVLAQP